MDTKQSLYTELANLAKPIAQECADKELTDLKARLKRHIEQIEALVKKEVVLEEEHGAYKQFCKDLEMTKFAWILKAHTDLLSAFDDCARYQEPESESRLSVDHQKKQLESLQELAAIFPKVWHLMSKAKPSYYDPIYGRNLVDVQTFLQRAEGFLNAL
jgi:hypothetical protein